jgi:ribosomal protein L37AE/L43A
MDTRRSQDLDVDGIGRRQHVDIRNLSEVASSLRCSVCKQPLAQVDTHHHSTVWYCSQCEVFRETTAGGSVLRTFKKDANQVVNLEGDNGY